LIPSIVLDCYFVMLNGVKSGGFAESNHLASGCDDGIYNALFPLRLVNSK